MRADEIDPKSEKRSIKLFDQIDVHDVFGVDCGGALAKV